MLGHALLRRVGISSTIRCRGWSPSFCGRRQGVAAKPPQVSVSPLRRRGGGRSPSGSFPIAPPPLRAHTYKLVSDETLAGRGGSVSRRDHNRVYRRRVHTAWAHKSERKVKPIPIRSSGGGVWGGGASLREAAASPESPQRNLFGREREGGDFSARKGLSLAITPTSSPLTFLLQ